jgi:L,D-peptidoglycan transpeptidase YkuD (ErfK/YbiS/YcfS/YnhG family)
MSVGRALSSGAVVLAVAGCATLAVGMSRAATAPNDSASAFSMPTLTTAPAVPAANATAYAAVATSTAARASQRPVTTPPRVAVSTRAHGRTAAAPAPAPRKAVPAATGPAATTHAATTAPKAAVRGQSLPVAGHTYTASRVLTVTARSRTSTTATLQPWVRAPGGGWLKHGTPIAAHVGSDGLSSTPSESRSATPIGSFRLTQAFGAYADPGTALPYFRTNSADWWISQAGPLYNTHQHCSSGCAFTRGAPNEHLAYELPYYRYAVVIDYNTRNAPGGVHQGKGSAFFLHVTDGRATAGCVAIAQSRLVPVLRWLTPSTHPRILIGVA